MQPATDSVLQALHVLPLWYAGTSAIPNTKVWTRYTPSDWVILPTKFLGGRHRRSRIVVQLASTLRFAEAVPAISTDVSPSAVLRKYTRLERGIVRNTEFTPKLFIGEEVDATDVIEGGITPDGWISFGVYARSIANPPAVMSVQLIVSIRGLMRARGIPVS